jgi:hypothetical protein
VGNITERGDTLVPENTRETVLAELCATFSRLPPNAKGHFLAWVAHNSTVDARSAYANNYEHPDGIVLRKANEFVHRVTGYIMHVLDGTEGKGQDTSVIAMIFEVYGAGNKLREKQLADWMRKTG